MSSSGLSAAPSPLRSVSLRAGDRIDSYVIDSLVARSGMASIFRATELATGRPVAIKAPHPEMEADATFLGRFEREAAIGSDLDHPGVMKVYAGEKRTHLYMAMEWVEGRELRKLLKERNKLPPERAIAIAAGICRALDYIHSRGVVHRDLKPENIMVDDEDRTKLIDFGIAGCAGARRLTFGDLSSVMGTPDYISPEQIQGSPGDGRSDIYALGVMLYEMLTGEAPFHGPNPFAIMNDRLVNNPVPPRELDPAIPPQLQEIVYRALRRDPAMRYATAGQLAWDLEHPEAVEISDCPELRDWNWRKRPLSRSIAIYAGLALIPAIVFILLLCVARF